MNKKAISPLLILIAMVLVSINQYDSETKQFHLLGYVAIVVAILAIVGLINIYRSSK